MDALLGHVADDEIPDGDVVDVLVVRPERGLRVIARRPAGAVEDRAVFADEGIAAFRGDQRWLANAPGSQTVGRPGWVWLTVNGIEVPGEIFTAPAGQVMLLAARRSGQPRAGAATAPTAAPTQSRQSSIV